MKNRIGYLFLLLIIPLQLVATDHTVSVTANTCGNAQTYTVPDGEQMVLHAHPIEGYIFSKWSDGNIENPRIVTITADVSYMAEFVAIPLPTTYDVTVYAVGCTPKVISIAEGEQLLLNAHPMAGYNFSQWSDGNTDNPRIVTITSDVSYTAEFVAMSPMPTTYDVTVYADGCATPKVIPVAEGEQILLNAHAKSGYTFSQWSDGNTDNPRMVTINADATYVAEFVESGETTPSSTYHFTVKAEDCQQAFVRDMEPSTQITLYAHPEEGNAFIAWSDGNTDNPRTITLEQNTNLVATFTSDESEESHIRNVQAGYFGTICLPYGSTNYTGADFYEVAYMEDLLLFLDKVSTLEAGMPYIYYAYADQIQVYSDGTHADMPSSHNGLYGTFTDITAASNYLQGKYIVHENTIRLCGNNCSLPAYRAYVILDEVSRHEPALRPGAQRICMAIRGNNTTTSLDNITEETHISPSQKGIYDVLGRRLDQPTSSGFYIINGEKVILVK